MGAAEKATKKLLFVTGTRADFGKLEPLALLACDQGFDVTFWVTGMHMLERYDLLR
jgi:UDP-N-acetylglucosamine 2-epimerase (hydrolysing)